MRVRMQGRIRVAGGARLMPAGARAEFALLLPQTCALHPLRRRPYALARSGAPRRLLWWTQALLLAAELRRDLAPPGLPPGHLPGVLGIAEALVPRACQAGLDYERLETLGDACLKFSASLHLYHAFPAAHEGQLTARKNRIVSNAALARVGLGLGLQRFIAQPPAAYDGAAGAPAAAGSVRTKVLADVVEALAGAFFCGGGGAAAAEALLRRAGALPPTPRPPAAPPAAPAAPAGPDAPKIAMLSAVEDTLGHRFAQRRLLAEALTHCSWPDRALPCNQRLELLGDAVLDLLITRHYALAWRLPPGRLTVLRSACLNNGRLAAAAAAHGLQRFLRHASQDLFAEVGRFVAHVRREVDSAASRHAAGPPAAGQPAARAPGAGGGGGSGGCGGGGGPAPGAAAHTLTLTADAGGAGRGAGATEALRAVYDGMVAAGFGQGDALAAPKVLGDMVEALVGAVFLDAGQDLEATWVVVARLLQPMPHPDTVPIHPVSVLMERCQQAGVSLAYAREPSDQPGCVSVSAVVDGRAVGRCAAALGARPARCWLWQMSFPAQQHLLGHNLLHGRRISKASTRDRLNSKV